MDMESSDVLFQSGQGQRMMRVPSSALTGVFDLDAGVPACGVLRDDPAPGVLNAVWGTCRCREAGGAALGPVAGVPAWPWRRDGLPADPPSPRGPEPGAARADASTSAAMGVLGRTPAGSPPEYILHVSNWEQLLAIVQF